MHAAGREGRRLVAVVHYTNTHLGDKQEARSKGEALWL